MLPSIPIRVVIGAAALMAAGACASPTPTAFRITDPSGRPVAGAHARIILLDAGAPLPVSVETIEEGAMLRASSGGFSDGEGRIVLPVLGDRDHLIEIEGPVLGVPDPQAAPVAAWFYRASDGSVVPSGQTEQPLRLDRIE